MIDKLKVFIDKLKEKRNQLNEDGRGFEVQRLSLIIESLEEIVENN